MKLMVIGNAEHGKDTVCNILKHNYGLNFVSSSFFVAEKAVRPYLAKMGIVYPTLEDCYGDRVNHRPLWFDAIAAYNAGDPARLGRELFAEYDVYCGLRNIAEFEALKAEKAFDFCFWVDASRRRPKEDVSSNTMHAGLANWIIDNNGNEGKLINEVMLAMSVARHVQLWRDGEI